MLYYLEVFQSFTLRCFRESYSLHGYRAPGMYVTGSPSACFSLAESSVQINCTVASSTKGKYSAVIYIQLP